jgi:hypothetical protein
MAILHDSRLKKSAIGGGFNSMQRTMIRPSGRGVADVGAVEGGWTLHEIGHLFDRRHTSIQGILSRTGGIRPRNRGRSLAALSLDEREEISRALVTGE